MTIQIEDILSITCTSVKLSLSNDFQMVFVLSTASEAKLAFDILVAYGFDVKAYPQDDDTSKLYITHPTVSANQLQEVLVAAKAYATALKQMKNSLDTLCNGSEQSIGSVDYDMTFANLHPRGKQIIIKVATGANDNAQQAVNAQPAQAAVSAAVPSQSAATQYVAKTKMKPKTEEDGLSSGPAVGRGKYPKAVLSADGTPPKESTRRRVFNYMFGNMANSGFFMGSVIVGVAILFTIAVFAKGLLCPDFASMKKNASWYCQSSGDDDEEQKKQQRQKQLGLPPTTEQR